jgi:hypothetical protein
MTNLFTAPRSTGRIAFSYASFGAALSWSAAASC